ncbi:hypothetical protein HD806DRAFT_490178 [Xylariaceae sp. AK1471]|nr:hypothetical protein HD806DRAFT_490178 [Xylariaceae sp. AK1471]
MTNQGQSSIGASYDQGHMENGSNDEETGPLVEGISNDDVWRLTRRFNKQIFHLKESQGPLPGGLDFNVAEEEDFSPNKFRAQVERLYMGVLVGLMGCFKQLVRLRSWREPRRTALLCMTYFAAWAVNYLGPLLIATTIALISSPKVRAIMFPPAPLALVDYETGGVAKPKAGVLGSVDSATGAPENYKGEAVENEASNFVTGLAAIAMNILTDEDPQHDKDQKSSKKSDALPAPNEVAVAMAVAKDKATGVDRPSLDKTKKPMEETMWSAMKPIMHLICRVSDTWERSANLLRPMGALPHDKQRQRLVGSMIPLFIVSLFINGQMVYRVSTFAIGLGLFGDPILTRAYAWLDLKNLRLNNTILKGVPTDVQMTIMILRFGEARKTPLPPPPLNREVPVDEPYELNEDVLDSMEGDQPLGATGLELHEATAPDHDMVNKAGGGDGEAPETDNASHAKWRGRAVHLARSGAKAIVKTAMGVDKMRAKAGKESAKTRLGAVPPKGKSSDNLPSVFDARYHGIPGYVYLISHIDNPYVCFSTEAPTDGTDYQGLHPLWTVPVNDIITLNKYHGYGSKSKLLAGWALEKEIRDGLEIVDRYGDQKVIAAMPRRDQLFNRLCAIGGQKWEIW